MVLLFVTTHSFSQVVNTTPVNLVGSSDPIPGPGGFFLHPFTPSPLTGTYHGGTFYGGTREKWGYNITGLTPGSVYTLTVYYMMDVVIGTPNISRVGNLTMLSGAPLDVVLIPYIVPANWRNWYTLTTTFTAIGTTDRIDIEADGISDNSLWLFTDMAIDGGGVCDDIVVTASATEICLGNAFTLTGTSTTGGTITWDGGLTNAVPFTPASAGTFTFNASSTSPSDCAYSTDIIVNALPTVVANADNTNICVGESVTLTGSGATTYTWDLGVTNGVAFAPAATATYTVTGTDANDCVNTDDIVVTVNPLPIIDAGLDHTICLGAATTLNGTGAGVGGTYTWDLGVIDGAPFNPAATATYTVTGTDANNCANTDDVTVTVNATPLIDAGLDHSICLGEATTLNGSGAGVGGTYTWDLGVIDGAPFNPGATAIYTVTGTDADGCFNTDDVTVTVNATPVIDAGLDQEICLGEATTLNGSGAGVGGMYTWDLGVIDGAPFNPGATATYTVTGTDANDCSNTDDVTVTVNPLPVIDAGLDYAICFGDETTLNGAGAGVGGVYTWTGGVTDGVLFTPFTTQNYTVTGTDANGCINTDVVTVTVNPLPVVSFMADNLIGCTPMEIRFTSLGEGDTFVWDFGDGSIGSSATPTHVYTNSGLYDVTLTATTVNGCVTSVTYLSYINIMETPIASFSYMPTEIDVTNTRVHFTNNSLYADTYEWNFGDGTALNFEETPTHEYPITPNANYNVTLIASNANGCQDIAEQLVHIKDVLLYFMPNTFTPDGDDFNESFKPMFASGLDVFDYHIMIFNKWGEMVFESFNVDYGWNGTYGGNELVKDGAYIWKIEFGETMSDKKHFVEGHVIVLK